MLILGDISLLGEFKMLISCVIFVTGSREEFEMLILEW